MTDNEKEFTLPDFFRLLKHRKGFIAGCALLVGIFLTFVALASDPVYEADTSIQITAEAGGLGAISEYLTISGGSPLTSEIEIFRSRSVAESVIDEISLRLDVSDVTWGNPVSKAFRFVFSDRLKRGLRSLRVEDLEFPPDSVDKKYFLTFTDDSGNFRLSGPGGDLGEGRLGEAFSTDGLTFTVSSMKGPAGTRFALTPMGSHQTLLNFRERLKVATLGSATRTNLIQVSFKSADPSLASDVANEIVAEYERRNSEWKLSMGQGQTSMIESSLSEVLTSLGEAEIQLEEYKNQHGVVALPEEARLAVSELSQREAEKIDINLRLSMLQGIHSSLAASLEGDTFAVPPSLTADPLINVLAADHAKLVVELDDLLLDYTENHPWVIAKKESIRGVRENILEAIFATTRSLIEQRADLDSVISNLEQMLYNIPGVERNLVELTRNRDVADDAYRLLLNRLNETKLITSSFAAGNRIIDHALPPERPVAPSIKRNLGMGLVLGLVLGMLLAFLLEVADPRLRRKDQLDDLLGAIPLAVIRKSGGDETAEASSTLALAILRSGKPSIALVCPGIDTPGLREHIENIIIELSRGVQPVLLIDLMPGSDMEGFFGAAPAPGLTEIANNQPAVPQNVEGGRIKVLPPGSDSSSAYVASQKVRDRITELQDGVNLTLFHLPNFANDPALRGWAELSGGAVLVLQRNRDLQSEILHVCLALESDNVPVLAALMFDA